VRATVTRDGVAIAWDAVDAEGTVVRIYRYRRGQAPAAIAEMPAAQQTFTDRQAPAGNRYFYFVVSVRDGVESGRSSELSVRP
jgi:fibronectin type 3 domain-containing protein